MRAIGASEKMPSVSAGRISWLKAARNVSRLPVTQAVDQVEAGDRGGAVANASSLPIGAGDQPSW